MFAKGGPNPNVGKLLLGFLISKEGQEMIRGFNRTRYAKTWIQIPPDSREVSNDLSYSPNSTTITKKS
jgi:ABC-type Fe3+ transport system substrate-binding protein